MAVTDKERARRECDEILAEHRRIDALIADIGDTSDLDALAGKLDSLALQLKSHFEREQAADGLHAVIAKDASHAVPALDHLVSEHKVFLATVQDIMGRVIGGSVDQERINKELADLFDALKDHEQQETDLFAEVICLDEGGSG